VVAFLFVTLAVCVCAPGTVHATANGNGDCDEADGNCTYIVETGTYIAGEEIGETRFDPETDLADIDLPCGLTLEDLDGYEITVLGAFNTHSPNTVHLVTEGDPIPPAVQKAFAFAAPFLDQMP
jgi:hypothetical protein